MKGTWLNVTTVAIGSALGLALGKLLPPQSSEIAISGIGLVVIGMGLKLFLSAKNILVVVSAIVLGGVIGLLAGISPGLADVGEWLKGRVGGSGSFSEGFVAASILFCVGPMTLLGSLQDGLEGKSELLQLKSVLDGVAAFFLSASLGIGVAFSILTILIIQGGLTLFSRRLTWLKHDEAILGDLEGVGGTILFAIGLGLLEIKRIPSANFIPALALVPIVILLGRRFGPITKLLARESRN